MRLSQGNNFAREELHLLAPLRMLPEQDPGDLFQKFRKHWTIGKCCRRDPLDSKNGREPGNGWKTWGSVPAVGRIENFEVEAMELSCVLPRGYGWNISSWMWTAWTRTRSVLNCPKACQLLPREMLHSQQPIYQVCISALVYTMAVAQSYFLKAKREVFHW